MWLALLALLVTGCQGASIQSRPLNPQLKILSQELYIEETGGSNVIAKGHVYFANISKIPAKNVRIQIVFMSDGKILGTIDKDYPFETIEIDQVKYFEFSKELYAPTNEDIELLINSWYKR